MGVHDTTRPDFTVPGLDSSLYKGRIDAMIEVLARLAASFAPHAQTTPDMTVVIDAGVIPKSGATATEVALQTTAAFTAPTTNPRKDIIYVDALTGAYGVAAGAESATPVDPAVPAGKVAVARVNLTVAQTEIANDDMDDLRSFGMFNTGTGDGNLPVLDANGLAFALALAKTSTRVEVTDDVTIGAAHWGRTVVLTTATGAVDKDANLPAASTVAGAMVVIRNEDADDAFIVTPDGADTVGGEADVTLAQGEWRMLWSDGVSDWVVLAGVTAGAVDVQDFPSNGTWTKPAEGTLAFLEAWAGGASGARYSNGGGGGGGGAYVPLLIPLALMGATESVTIGAGGAAKTSGNVSGDPGGNTSIGSLLTAYGGGGGSLNGPGGGGGGDASVGQSSASAGGAGGGYHGGAVTSGTQAGNPATGPNGGGGGATGGNDLAGGGYSVV